MAQAKKNKKNNKKNYNKREPYQRAASVENAGARIGMGIIFLILGAVTAVSYFIQDGTVIVGIREFMSGVLGYGFWALAVCFIWVAVIIFQGNRNSFIRIICILLIPVLFSSFIDLLSYDASSKVTNVDVAAQANIFFEKGQNFRCGGVLSGLLVMTMVHLLSRVGACIVILILLVICVAMAVSEPQAWYGTPSKRKSGSSGKDKGRTASSKNSALAGAKATASGVGATLGALWSGESGAAAKSGRRFDPSSLIHMSDDNGGDTLYDLRDEAYPDTVSGINDIETNNNSNIGSNDRPRIENGFRPEIDQDIGSESSSDKSPSGATSVKRRIFSHEEDEPMPVVAPVRVTGKKKSAKSDDALNPPADPIRGGEISAQRPSSKTDRQPLRDYPSVNEEEPEDMEPVIRQRPTGDKGRVRVSASSRSDIKEPEKITRKDANKAAKTIASQISKAEGEDYSYYEFPPSALLKPARSEGQDSEREIYENKLRLENALHSFGVNSQVVRTTRGPTVTRYDIELEQGVKLTKVTNLSNDLALALGVVTVRIAPIPDEISTVGIEVPNKIINTVSLRELIDSDEFQNAASRLSFAIGKDIGGHAIIGNISKLPHMLIAGTTGSGKSVCMNSLIISLLYKAKPDEVKFIMIDPKMVELGIYNSIPHLYVPVVTEPKKAAGALQWSVVEMLKRYRLFSEAGVRDLEGYNQYCRNNAEQPLPQVVIVIDELADLMMAASKEVEESICRIAQMGRAAGMHLVIATQRPSADVITGLMKANIPSRIAFAVSSALESRIILDQGGADKLIGHGDMLYAPIGCGKPLRVQGSFVSDDEREKIIKYISSHSTFTPETNDEINQYMNKAMEGKNGPDNNMTLSSDKKNGSKNDSGYDDMLSEAVEVVLEVGQCSVSMLQRRIKLGYSRAARIVDQMEELGIVGPYEGAKPRSVAVSRDEWNIIKAEKLGLQESDDYAVAAEFNE